MTLPKTFLVFGATGQTGQHLLARALRDGHHVRVLARTPAKLRHDSEQIEVVHGSITDSLDLVELLRGVDFVVAMLGDTTLQQQGHINTDFVRRLIPAMRRTGVKRFLYQAGALSVPPDRKQPAALRAIRRALPRGYAKQHEDNEAVMRYLIDDASDIEWMVHRAGIGSDGPSRGVLERSDSKYSVATFIDCADYNYRTVQDSSAARTLSFSRYNAKS